ncbi:hypothetical protein M9979_12270 [Sphingomonas sp. RP10(2022)]|uniref:Uncharacterized protein n=1 Tax=Sphingomonas liriopis TaxID=2949094 RepID=A0A9X2HYB4_9SPHN|nr:hypothetical protein [Sphingomonas liriopis]MCP3735649.1 hypothetical protein [Sphingomonas liriopis]
MSGFDFRDMLGGAAAGVEPDDALADGASAEHAQGLCAHLMRQKKHVGLNVEQLCRAIIYTANATDVCAGGLLALIVERMSEIAFRESSEDQRDHLIAEVIALLPEEYRG